MIFYEIAILNTPNIFTYFSYFPFKKGDFVEVEVKNRKKIGVVLQEVKKPSYECKETKKIGFLDENRAYLAEFISSYYFSSLGESFGLFYHFENDYSLLPIKYNSEINLSLNQEKIYNLINKEKVSILFGDTGSGKTEIYMKFIQDYINQNKTIIFLLPEISITSQIEKRLKNIFGDFVAIWHSKITKAKKNQILSGIKEGKIRIIVGARSALFLPLKNLGLIIVDEEHDDSYKAQSSPRYNAKDMAILFGKKFDAKVILGSATPLVSDIYKFKTFRLKGNFYNSKKDIFFTPNRFDDFTIDKISSTLKQNKQVVIFLPTRANFKYMICNNCSEVVKCPYCDVAMSIHTTKRVLKCHYCDYTTKIFDKCPSCGGEEFINERIGTSEVVEILKEKFPNNTIAKLDKDELTSKSRMDKILQKFANKEIDILVGTQMISKGHDYDVKLAIVIDIDFVLNIPDFRSREKALSLVKQVSGRAGRKEDGEVIIQTSNSEFFSQSYDEFVKEELEMRKVLNYPPFFRIAKILFSDKDEQKAKNECEKMKKCLEGKVEIIGSGEAFIKKIAGKYRYNILIKGQKFHNILYKCKTKNAQIDIDSVNFI